MEFQIKTLNKIISWFNKTVLYNAVEKENIEIIQLLLSNDKIDVNILNIFIIFILFKIKKLNEISNQNIEWNFKSKYWMKFQIKILNKISNQNIE